MFKKILAMMLAVMTVLSLSSVAFAAEIENEEPFVPAPGVKAPDDWYDPYCYESDGRINKYCLAQGGTDTSAMAMYCPEHKKIFTVSDMGRVKNPKYNPNDEYDEEWLNFFPYEVECKDWAIISRHDNTVKMYDSYSQWFCPYCGQYEQAYYTNEEEYRKESALYTHEKIASVYYGYQCEDCDRFIACNHYATKLEDNSNPYHFRTYSAASLTGCRHYKDINTVKLYRFLYDEHKNAEYSFIFKETEKDFGDGKDGSMNDLKMDSGGRYTWNSPDNPYRKVTFFEKVAAFFASIADFFKRIFTGIFNF